MIRVILRIVKKAQDSQYLAGVVGKHLFGRPMSHEVVYLAIDLTDDEFGSLIEGKDFTPLIDELNKREAVGVASIDVELWYAL